MIYTLPIGHVLLKISPDVVIIFACSCVFRLQWLREAPEEDDEEEDEEE